MATFLGIDPGLEGALAWLADGRAWAVPMPTLDGKRRSLDLRMVAELLQEHPCDLCSVEEVSPAPVRGRAQGALSMFSFGRGLGQLEGLLSGLAVPYQLVRPQTWKAEVLKGTSKDKAAAIAFCQRRFPGVCLTPGKRRVPHDGISDALCLALHARRVMRGAE